MTTSISNDDASAHPIVASVNTNMPRDRSLRAARIAGSAEKQKRGVVASWTPLTTQIDSATLRAAVAMVGSAVFVTELESTVRNVPSDVATRATGVSARRRLVQRDTSCARAGSIRLTEALESRCRAGARTSRE